MTPARTGYNSLETTLNTSNVSGLKYEWGVGLPGGVLATAISGNTLFAYTGSPNPSSSEGLTAINLTTHKQKWAVGLTGGGVQPLSSTIAVASGDVFEGCGVSGSGGVCAYSQKTGALAWAYSAQGGGPNQGLTYDSGVVYVGLRFYFHNNNGLYAINATNGTTLWRNTTYWPVDNGFAPAVGNGYVYYNCNLQGNPSENGVCALSQTTGALAWSVVLNYGPDSGYVGITVGKGVVYAHTTVQVGTQCCGGEVFALNASTGAQLWGTVYNPANATRDPFPVALAKGVLYVSGVDYNRYAMKGKTGTVIWKQAYNGFDSAPTVANGVVYANGSICSGPCNSVSAYDANSGKVLWTAPASNSTYNPPPIVLSGKVYAANVSSGSVPCDLCVFGLSSSEKRRR